MHIGNLRGAGGVERSGDRQKPETKRTDDATRPAVRDQAAISAGGRETAASVDALTEKAGSAGDGDRHEMVQRAIRRLMNGELDTHAVHQDVARQLVQGDFTAG